MPTPYFLPSISRAAHLVLHGMVLVVLATVLCLPAGASAWSAGGGSESPVSQDESAEHLAIGTQTASALRRQPAGAMLSAPAASTRQAVAQRPVVGVSGHRLALHDLLAPLRL